LLSFAFCIHQESKGNRKRFYGTRGFKRGKARRGHAIIITLNNGQQVMTIEDLQIQKAAINNQCTEFD